MTETLNFIKDRAVKTISAAKSLAATWLWTEKPPTQMQADLCAIIGNPAASPPILGQEQVASTAEQTAVAANALWDAQLTELHQRTVMALGMLRNRQRHNAAASAVLQGLSASSHSHKETLAEALALESAWNSLDPAWSPTASNTLPAFKALRKQCAEDLLTAASDAHSNWRSEVGKLNALASALEASNEAWYADATKVFSDATPAGQMIRATVPTTYAPQKGKRTSAPVPAPVPVQPEPGGQSSPA